MKNIVLEPLPIDSQDNDFVRRCKIIRNDNNVKVREYNLWFQFPKSVKPPKDNDCDSYLIAMLMDAMKEGRQIIVKGSVSHKLLANLMEYQAAWNKWLPDLYKIVDISVETIREREIPAPGAVCAFSGGVDATFSVWRHTQRKLKYGSQNINFCTLIHGFDIPLGKKDIFEIAFEQCQATLKDIDVDLIPIANNYRKISKVPWEHSHACALIAALNNFKHMGGNCVVGSTESYNSLVIPWATSPITDHLLSSGDFIVIHDGASHNRTEKVSEIVDWEVGINKLRVCWGNQQKNLNCGVCEKCIRTKMNFLVSQNSIPDCFPPTNNFNQDIKKIRLRSKIARAYWQEIVKIAKANQIDAEWVTLAEGAINREVLRAKILPEGSYREKLIGGFRSNLNSLLNGVKT